MPEGPFGGPRPLAESRCKPLLLVNIQINDNRWKFTDPEGMNNLVDVISDSTGYIERNIYIRESSGPAEGYDFYAVVVPGTGEYMSSVMRSVEQMEDEVGSIDGVRSVNVTLGAGDPEEQINMR